MDDQKCYGYSRLCVCVKPKMAEANWGLTSKVGEDLGFLYGWKRAGGVLAFHGPGWDSPSEDKQIMPWVHLLEEALPGTWSRFPVNGDQPSLQESTRCWLKLWPLTQMGEPEEERPLAPPCDGSREWNQRMEWRGDDTKGQPLGFPGMEFAELLHREAHPSSPKWPRELSKWASTGSFIDGNSVILPSAFLPGLGTVLSGQ